MAKASKPAEGETSKTSFLLKVDHTKKLKLIAAIEGTTQTEIIDKLLEKFISDWEKKNGKVPVR